MSRIYFHSEHDTAELRGSERAYMGVLCNDLMLGTLGDLYYAKEWLIPLMPPGHYALTDHRGPESGLSLFLRGMDSALIVDGKRVETWLVSLNTAWVLGGDPLRLLARLHGQCEIHCWVEGVNRKWLASIMREGRKSGLCREDQGWEAVADLLESRDDCPVVCSYSVCEQFPNYGCLPDDHPLKTREDEARHDDFYELPPAEAWQACMAGLRAQGSGLELRPDKWADFRFGTGHSAFTLRHQPKAKAA